MSTTRTKSPAAKKAAAPFQLGKRSAETKREPLFTIDDEIYTMPVAVPAGDAIMLTTILRLQPDEDSRGVALIRGLCGQAALDALLGESTMTRSEWKGIVKVLTDRAFGPAEREEEAEGN